MIFIGDIALPFEGAISYSFPNSFKEDIVVGNLEGALVKKTERFLSSQVVVNSVEAIDKLNSELDIYFSINNNHILDNKDFSESRENFRELEIRVFGAGENISIASKPLIIEKEKKIILNFGWNIIECQYAKKTKAGVNPLKDNYVLKEVKKYRNKYSDYKLIVFFHWNYELEKFPMPSQRFLSHRLIDLGCDLIVGNHPHRIQGYEVYKGKPIIYSLGNFLFTQNVYMKGRLQFPDFCNRELAFQYMDDGNHKCLFFNYDKEKQKLTYEGEEPLLKSKLMNELSAFKNIPIENYDEWFKENRYHKKLIPTYNYNDSNIKVLIKDYYNKKRTFIINVLFRIGIKDLIKKILFNN